MKTQLRKGDLLISCYEVAGFQGGEIVDRGGKEWVLPEQYSRHDALQFLQGVRWHLYEKQFPYESALARAVELTLPKKEPIPNIIRVHKDALELLPETRWQREHYNSKTRHQSPKRNRTITSPISNGDMDAEFVKPHDTVIEILEVTRVWGAESISKTLFYMPLDAEWPLAEVQTAIEEEWESLFDETNPYDWALAEALASKYSKPSQVPKVIGVSKLTKQFVDLIRTDRKERNSEYQQEIGRLSQRHGHREV